MSMIPSPYRAAVVPEQADGTGNFPVMVLRGHRLTECVGAFPTRAAALDFAEEWNRRHGRTREDRRRPQQRTLFRTRRATSKPKPGTTIVIPVEPRPAVVLPALIKADDSTRQRFLFEEA